MDLTKSLVTGGAGFLGSNLIKRLLDANEEVTCLDNFFNNYTIFIRDLYPSELCSEFKCEFAPNWCSFNILNNDKNNTYLKYQDLIFLFISIPNSLS